MAWTIRQHSNGAIDCAGAALVQAARPAELDNELLAVINNWRGFHAYPHYYLDTSAFIEAIHVATGE